MVHELWNGSRKTVSPLGIDLVGDETVCPYCGTHLKLKNSRKRKSIERWYFTIATTYRGISGLSSLYNRKTDVQDVWKHIQRV